MVCAGLQPGLHNQGDGFESRLSRVETPAAGITLENGPLLPRNGFA
ncbi:hypothetical protein BH18VER2_BH18VER2_00750 [soil metagenome]